MTKFTTDQYVTIDVAGETLYCVQRVDGTRYASRGDFGKAVGKAANSVSDFLNGKSPEALQCKALGGLGLYDMKHSKGNKPISGVPEEWGVAYWHYQARLKNPKAISLVRALTQEALDVRIDGALGIQLTMQEVNDRSTLVREALLSQYTLLVQQNQSEEDPFTVEAEARSTTIHDIYYNQMTSLEREVALERQLDASGDDIWRIGLEEGVDTVTDSTGVLVATVETVERYKRRDQMLQQKQGV